MQSVVDAMATGDVTPNDERALERWPGCTAQSGPLDFGVNNNGVLYSADVPFVTETPITEAKVRGYLSALPITWSDSDPTRGTSGIYSVAIESISPLLISVSSPCYFLKKADDGGTISTRDKELITGFTTKPWNE